MRRGIAARAANRIMRDFQRLYPVYPGKFLPIATDFFEKKLKPKRISSLTYAWPIL